MRLLLADDHDLVRDAVGRLIEAAEPGAEIVLAADFASAFAALSARDPIDLALIDWQMPGMDGLTGLRRLAGAAKGRPVAVFSGAATRHEIDAALQLGVSGFVPKTLSGPALMAALRLMIAGERYIPAALHEAPEAAPSGVRGAERSVLDQLFLGRSNKEIAAALGLPESSVKLHLRTLSRKLDARNRTEVIIRAMQRGLGPDFVTPAARGRGDG